MAKILIVDDEPAVIGYLSLTLSKAGFEVVTAADGEAALEAFGAQSPDLVILDVNLPKLNGLEVCRRLRQTSQVPIMILTVMGEELDKVLGLESGADDYLTKPFGVWELLARVKAVLRRSRMGRVSEPSERYPDAAAPASILKAGELEVDLISRRVTRKGTPVALKPKEFDLLAFLAARPGEVFSRGELARRVWGYEDAIDTRTVIVHIRWLRQKLEADPSSPRLIETVRGRGYRFRA